MDVERNPKVLLSVRMEKCKQASNYISRNRGLLLCSKVQRAGKDLPDAPCSRGLGSISGTRWPEKHRFLGGLP